MTQNKKIETQVQKDERTLEELAKEFRKRGNRLEVMNGKAYEVIRKYVKDVEETK